MGAEDAMELDWTQLNRLTDEVRSDAGPGTDAWHAEQSHTHRFNAALIEAFRAHGGRVPGELGDVDMLLLTVTGARSGRRYTVPLGYHRIEGRLIVVASMGGADRNPPWFHNVRANPDVTVELGGETFEATALIPTGEERDRLFAGVVASFAVFGEYQERSRRTIPVVELVRKP